MVFLRSLGGAILLLPVLDLSAAELQWGATQAVLTVAPDRMGAETEFVLTYAAAATAAPLRIALVESHCPCTRARADAELMKPGDSARIHVVVDATGRSGRQRTTIDVVTVPSSVPTTSAHLVQTCTTLTLYVDCPVLPELSPSFVQWSVGAATAAQRVSLRLPQGCPYTPTGVRLASDLFAALLEPGATPADFSIVVSPRSTAGPADEEIDLQTSVAGKASRVFKIQARVRGVRAADAPSSP